MHGRIERLVYPSQTKAKTIKIDHELTNRYSLLAIRSVVLFPAVNPIRQSLIENHLNDHFVEWSIEKSK